MSGIDTNRPFVALNIAVLTISDTRALADDKSGDTLAQRLRDAGHTLAARDLVKDDIEAIRGKVAAWIADPGVDVIITTGGTGFTGRDVPPEAIEPLLTRRWTDFRSVPQDFLRQDRGLDGPVAGDGRRGECDLRFRLAGITRGLQGRLGQYSRPAARLPSYAVQFRRDPAAPQRTSAARLGAARSRRAARGRPARGAAVGRDPRGFAGQPLHARLRADEAGDGSERRQDCGRARAPASGATRRHRRV